jgi:hypothetical protein
MAEKILPGLAHSTATAGKLKKQRERFILSTDR